MILYTRYECVLDRREWKGCELSSIATYKGYRRSLWEVAVNNRWDIFEGYATPTGTDTLKHQATIHRNFLSLFALSLCNRRLSRVAEVHAYRDVPIYVSNISWIVALANNRRVRTRTYHPMSPPVYLSLDFIPVGSRRLVQSVMYSIIHSTILTVEADHLKSESQ